MSTGERPGNRRIDRVLADDYLQDLDAQPLERIREMRGEAEQEEADLSYLRRLVQGRIDILQAELDRRSGAASGSLVDELPRILGHAGGGAHGLGRHIATEPSRADAHRRRLEAMLADVELSDVTGRSDEELRETLETLEGEERWVSDARRAVQSVMDSCAAEITRRYRDGQADVAQLLNPGG